MSTVLRGVVVLVSWLALMAAAAQAHGRAPARPAHGSKDSTLRIVVRSLPGRLSARIVVTGPHHVHKRVTRSSTLRLPAGSYSVTAGAVKAPTGSYYATTPRARVVLHAGESTSSVVAYATLVPKSTLVVPAGATSSLTGDPSEPRVLTITGPAAKTVKVGDSLSSGVTPAAPYGYLVKVTKIVHKSGASATLDVENTTLLAAVPTGELSAEQALEPTAEASSANDLRRVNLEIGRALHREMHGARGRAAGFTVNTANLECESSAGVHLGRPTLTFSPSMAIHATWGFLKLDSASISITAAESLSFGATADAGAHCSTGSPGIGLFPHPITLGTIDVQVGPVPVTITPKLQLYLSGQTSIEAKATFSLEQGASVTAGVSYEHGSYHPISSLSQHFTPAFTAEGDASGELALSPTVDTLIYDVAGPSFDVGAVAKLNANVKASPWWTLQGCLQAGLGFVISPLGLNWSDPHLIQICKTLLSASTPPPATAIAASSPPTITSAPVITDVEGNTPPKVGDTLEASTGSWAGSPTEYTYGWKDCNSAGSCSPTASSSTKSTYVVTPADAGSYLRVEVTAINDAGSSQPAPSATTGIIAEASTVEDGGPAGPPGVSRLPLPDAGAGWNWSANGGYHQRNDEGPTGREIVSSEGVITPTVIPSEGVIAGQVSDVGSVAYETEPHNAPVKNKLFLATPAGDRLVYEVEPGATFEDVALSAEGNVLAFFFDKAFNLPGGGNGAEYTLGVYNVAAEHVTLTHWFSNDAAGTLLPQFLESVDANGSTAVLGFCEITETKVDDRECGEEQNWVGEGVVYLSSPRSPELIPFATSANSGFPSMFMNGISADGSTMVLWEYEGDASNGPQTIDVYHPGGSLAGFPNVEIGVLCYISAGFTNYGGSTAINGSVSFTGKYVACETPAKNNTESVYLVDLETGTATLIDAEVGGFIPQWVAANGRRMIFTLNGYVPGYGANENLEWNASR
jgi:hypothetical protein